ncbi:MAG: B12-binding domain-containing radical SAM protein [Candidatus Thermoplasmatota archaeon]|nr:B12-binding domain-containing radical SAM protein [Candidatus Thermoplasmatota archaeon]
MIIGGPHCTLFPRKSLEETQSDICIQGQGENIILEIKKALGNKISLSQIPGIYYRVGSEIKKGLPYKEVCDLDKYPFPARHLVNHYAYGIGYNHGFSKGEFTSIVTSRGCPFSCRFCSRNSISMKKYSTRSTENILKEIREIKRLGYKYIAFVDDCFLSNKKQAKELFDAIIKENLNLKFYIAAARVDSADPDLYEKMKNAGVVFIQFGLESGNQDVLDFYKKNITVEEIKYAVNLSNEMGFYTVGSFIIGAPFETLKHFQKTINFAKSLPLVSVSFVPLKYMAGSELWEDAVKQGKINNYEYVLSANSKRDLAKFTNSELISIGKKAHRSFILRPKFFINFLLVSFKQGDFSFLLSYLSFYFNYILRRIHLVQWICNLKKNKFG